MVEAFFLFFSFLDFPLVDVGFSSDFDSDDSVDDGITVRLFKVLHFMTILCVFYRIKKEVPEIEIPAGNGRAFRGKSTVRRVSTSTLLRIFIT